MAAREEVWRLQQGESLTFMEVAHARLSSLHRNFVAKDADDISLDYKNCTPVDQNPHKHPFFTIIDRPNDRLQHLALLARMVLLERHDGFGNVNDTTVIHFIDEGLVPDGIGNDSYENTPVAKAVLRTLNVFYDIFKDDTLVKGGGKVKELKTEYFILSFFLLLRHLLKHYVFEAEERKLFKEFLIAFHARWKARDHNDNTLLVFADHRQQTGADIQVRHRILRQLFFEFVAQKQHQMLLKDSRRAFNEAERIEIYRRDNGLCYLCLAEGKSEKEAFVPWEEYDADHVIPHSKGGATTVENGRVTCRAHNLSKGARTIAN